MIAPSDVAPPPMMRDAAALLNSALAAPSQRGVQIAAFVNYLVISL